MSNEGVECIMTAAGGVNNGVYETCKEKSKYAVAVDMAQSYISPPSGRISSAISSTMRMASPELTPSTAAPMNCAAR